ncbi:MAG: hypothetical protein RQ752_09470 [Thermohalobaculum sp.]|nr:hypothetical protein [Thermohalobaculum sp.]
MISVLSGIVLMLAIGTLVQRGDVVADLFSGEPDPIVLVEDIASVDADTLARIDVLANDTGLEDADASRLVVLTQPECGRVFVQDGALQYLGDRNCAASQRIVYGISGVDTSEAGEVLVNVRGATGVARPAAEPAVAPVAQAPAAKDPATKDPAADDVVALRSTDTPAAAAREPAPTLPAAGSQGLGRAQGGAGAADAPARPGLASADAPAATGVPAVRAPATPAPGATASLPNLSGDAPMTAPTGFDRSATPAQPAPQVALRAPTVPGLPGATPPAAIGAARGSATNALPSGTAPGTRDPVAPALAGLADPSIPRIPAGLGSDLSVPSVANDSALAGIGSTDAAPEAAPERAAPGGLGHGVATLALARVEIPDAVAAPSSASSQGLSLDVGAGDSALSAPRLAPEIDATDGQRITILEPSAGLGEILLFGDPLTLRPIDTTVPQLAMPSDGGVAASDLRQAALQPPASTAPGATVAPAAQPGAMAEPDRVAALPRVDQTCAVPPSITLDIRPAGETELVITSPCHADSIAQLSYAGLDLGIRIDRGGQGAVTVLGFASSADAILAFDDGETLDFSLPFTGTDRVERVALAWDAPVALELHAIEFGAAQDGPGHINPHNPGDFREVRRRGGGYLTTYAPVEGVGQSVHIYSHWLRRGGEAGVVKLYIDFASRHAARLAGTCGDGPLARPAFTVIRASRGRIETPVSRRLASVDCAAVETMQSHLIEAAVRDIIISQR